MNKFKKVYVICSLVFAATCIFCTLFMSTITAKATEYDSNTEFDTEYGANNGHYGATENAPNASDDTKFPTTIPSTVLYNCCRACPAINGNAKRRISFQGVPSVIFLAFFISYLL